MIGTTNTGIATAGPEKRDPEVATILLQNDPGEVGERRLRRSLGRYQRFFLVALMALAFFGAVSAATPKEAQAAGTGWYWTNHNGQNYECFWIYHGNDANGNAVWTEDGCKYYYGGALPAYYSKFTTGQVLVYVNGAWRDTAYYWSNSSTLSNYITVGGANSAGINWFAAQSAIASNAIWLRSSSLASSSLSSEASTSSEAPSPGSEASAGSEAPSLGSEASTSSEAPQGVEASMVSEASTASTAFPWKICQDNRGCMKYGKNAWKQVKTKKAQGGTYRVSRSKRLGAFFAASGATDAGGRTMKLVTATGPKMGKAKVLVVNLSTAKVVKKVTFDLRTTKPRYKVVKKITGLTPHKPYGLVVLSANGRPIVVDAVGYEAHGSMCHNVV